MTSMTKLKEWMDDVYKEQRFSHNKKLETLQKARSSKPRVIHWMPIACMLSAAVVLFVLAGSWPQQIRELSISSILAPYNANMEMIERVEHFYAIASDGVVTDEERRAYVKTSDWLVQRALESGNSIFYNRPNVTEEQATAFNEMLYFMYEFIYTKKDAAAIAGQLQLYRNYDALLADVSRMNEVLAPFVERSYTSSLNEKPISNNAFLNAPWWVKLIAIVLFLLFCYSFYVNIKTNRRIVLGMIQLGLIVLLTLSFFKADDQLYGYDETSIAQSMDAHMALFEETKYVDELLAAAEFEGGRYGLAHMSNGQLLLAKFEEEDGMYVLRSSNASEQIVETMPAMDYAEDNRYIIGVAPNSGIAKYELVDEQTGDVYFIDIDPIQANIYQFIMPSHVTSMNVRMYDENGQLQ